MDQAHTRFLPRSSRLLDGLRHSVRRLMAQCDDAAQGVELAGMDAALCELALREDNASYRAHLHEAQALLDAVSDVLPPSLVPALAGDDPDPVAITADAGFEHIGRRIVRVQERLARAVAALDPGDAAQRALAGRIARLEHALDARRQALGAGVGVQAMRDEGVVRDAIRTYIERQLPGRTGLRVSRLVPLSGGFQKATTLCEACDEAGHVESLVIRSETSERLLELECSDIAREHELLKILHAAGMPVAEPIALECDTSWTGERFMVSRKVEGRVVGAAVASGGAMSERIARSFIDGISRVHRMPLDARIRGLPMARWLDLAGPREFYHATVDYYANQPWMDRCVASPAVARITRWLHDNPPEAPFEPCLVHCDFGPHNVLVQGECVAGILDWESARIGDPAEDIACFLQTCGDQLERGTVLEWYRQATGTRIDEYRLRYFDVLSCLKILVVCRSAEALFEHVPGAPLSWCIPPIHFSATASGTLEDKIASAERVRGHG